MVRSLAVARLSTTRADHSGGAVILGGGDHRSIFFGAAGRVLRRLLCLKAYRTEFRSFDSDFRFEP